MRSAFSSIRSWAVVLALVLVSVVARAQALPVPVAQFPTSTAGNVTTFGGATLGSANAASFTFAPAANSAYAAQASTTTALPLANGKKLPLTATANISKAAGAMAVSRFMLKSIPIIATIPAALELLDWIKAQRNSSGQIGTIQPVCQGACTDYVASIPGKSWGPYPTFGEALSAALAFYSGAWGVQAVVVAQDTPSGASYTSLDVQRSTGGPLYNLTISWSAGTPVPTFVAADAQTINDLILAAPTHPRMYELVEAAAKSGESVPTEVPQVTGPSSLPPDYVDAPTVVTTSRPLSETTQGDSVVKTAQETRTTTQPGADISYSGNKATVTPKSTTTTEQRVVTSITPVDPSAPGAPQPISTPSPWNKVSENTTTGAATDPTGSGTSSGSDYVDPCIQNPGRISCMEAGSPAQADTMDKKTKAFSLPSISFTSSTACPAPLPFTVFARSYSISYQPLCDGAALVRPVFLLLAAFAAAFILADGFRL